jgi:aminoglycoside N3'-acetyltransferase
MAEARETTVHMVEVASVVFQQVVDDGAVMMSQEEEAEMAQPARKIGTLHLQEMTEWRENYLEVLTLALTLTSMIMWMWRHQAMIVQSIFQILVSWKWAR